MHPALSIIVFTVITGLAYGWLALALILDLAHIASWHNESAFFGSVAVALILLVVGLMSSVLHLANPRNAWRSFMRVRTSWLSREAVLAVLFFPLFGAYVLCVWRNEGLTSGPVTVLLGWLSVLVAIATVFSTGMIYGCLRTIRQWHTPLVPANYLTMAFALGGLAIHAQRELAAPSGGSAVTSVVFGLLMLALVLKVIYWLQIGLPQGHTINTATGFRMATVRLLDVGHTAGTFLDDEFGYEVSKPVLLVLKVVVLLLVFIVPAALIQSGPGTVIAVTALLSAVVGALVERWLFFAEAQHVVRLYHGQEAN
jgi:DMSO reductase anchor subunit